VCISECSQALKPDHRSKRGCHDSDIARLLPCSSLQDIHPTYQQCLRTHSQTPTPERPNARTPECLNAHPNAYAQTHAHACTHTPTPERPNARMPECPNAHTPELTPTYAHLDAYARTHAHARTSERQGTYARTLSTLSRESWLHHSRRLRGSDWQCATGSIAMGTQAQ
jgi:hypothetical protein